MDECNSEYECLTVVIYRIKVSVQLTLSLKMTSVNNSPIEDYTHPDDHISPTLMLYAQHSWKIGLV